MFRKNLIPVWIGILVLAGFIMGAAGGCQKAPVHKTGQTVSYAVGDDGALQKGVAWPIFRLIDNGNGTVTDNLTGLIWTKAANCDLNVTWNSAVRYCNALANATCGLSDGSSAVWRLPNIKELLSLLDYGNFDPALPTGHPFTNVQNNPWYWSSTTYAYYADDAWGAYFGAGYVFGFDKDSDIGMAWCVRDGQ